MSKKIDSPVKRFPGSMTLSDPLTFPQSIAFAKGIKEARELEVNNREDFYEYVKLAVPAVAVCVESWDIEGVGDLTPDTFPSTPRDSAPELLGWIVGAVTALFRETEPEDPKK
jgi:hypothetical protein